MKFANLSYFILSDSLAVPYPALSHMLLPIFHREERLVISMKKNAYVFLLFILTTVNCFPASLNWGMTLKNFEKKFNTELKYETEKYSIVYLPKKSPYNNEFDEYLLFVNSACFEPKWENEKMLIRRIIYTDYSIDKCKEKIKKTNWHDDGYARKLKFPLDDLCLEKDAVQNSETFPSKNSFPVLLALLEKPYTYEIFEQGNVTPKKERLNCKFGGKDHGYYSCTGLFLEDGKNLIILDHDYFDVIKKDEYKYKDAKSDDGYTYRDAILKIIDVDTIKSFLATVRNIKEQKLKNSDKIEGPFGTYFGMKENDLYLMCENNAKPVDGASKLEDQIEYSKYYTIMGVIQKFVPRKSVDAVSQYYGFFDHENGLYQVFTIGNFSRAINIKEMETGYNDNEKSFSDLKTMITERYGKPKVKDKNFLYWILDKGVRIDLFSVDKEVELVNIFNGKKKMGWDCCTCLVYTDTMLYEKIHKEFTSGKKEILEGDGK